MRRRLSCVPRRMPEHGEEIVLCPDEAVSQSTAKSAYVPITSAGGGYAHHRKCRATRYPKDIAKASFSLLVRLFQSLPASIGYSGNAHRRASFLDGYRYAARLVRRLPVLYDPSIEQVDHDEEENHHYSWRSYEDINRRRTILTEPTFFSMTIAPLWIFLVGG